MIGISHVFAELTNEKKKEWMKCLSPRAMQSVVTHGANKFIRNSIMEVRNLQLWHPHKYQCLLS